MKSIITLTTCVLMGVHVAEEHKGLLSAKWKAIKFLDLKYRFLIDRQSSRDQLKYHTIADVFFVKGLKQANEERVKMIDAFIRYKLTDPMHYAVICADINGHYLAASERLLAFNLERTKKGLQPIPSIADYNGWCRRRGKQTLTAGFERGYEPDIHVRNYYRSMALFQLRNNARPNEPKRRPPKK